jgi:CRISPR-associated endonuclease Csn1
MFLLGLNDEVEICKENAAVLNKHLYRVQKVSSSYYTFRHHLASTLDNKNEEISIQSFGAWRKFNPIKVNIDPLGNIKRIN